MAREFSKKLLGPEKSQKNAFLAHFWPDCDRFFALFSKSLLQNRAKLAQVVARCPLYRMREVSPHKNCYLTNYERLTAKKALFWRFWALRGPLRENERQLGGLTCAKVLRKMSSKYLLLVPKNSVRRIPGYPLGWSKRDRNPHII